MTTELRFLAPSFILGLVHLIVDSHRISFNTALAGIVLFLIAILR